MTRKKKVAPKPAHDGGLYTRDVVGPSSVAIDAGSREMLAVGEWFQRFALYVEAMNSIGRAVLVKLDDDGRLYASSIEVDSQ